jgi:hypothetical protein
VGIVATATFAGGAAGAALAPGVALAAQGSMVAASTVETRPPPTALPPPAGRLVLYLPNAFFVRRQPVTVPRRSFRVVGIVRPYVAGQWVAVRTYLGGRLAKSDELRVRPSRGRRFGQFTESLTSRGVGGLTVTVLHAATRRQRRFSAQRRLSVLDERAGFGSSGRFVELIQQRLAALHLYVPQTGVYDQGTGLALGAYHRLLRWGTYQSLDGPTISFLLDGLGSFNVRFPRHGPHAEANLSRQVLALVDGSRVYRIYPISSGKPSTPTILGDFQVYSKTPGYLPDGMYYSSFFHGGYAVHGYDPAPDFPASHGCVRLPIVDAISVYDWLKIGDWVDTYY